MEIYNLIIEVTRKCNLQCEHCCRGGAQRKNLDIEKLQVLLSNVDYISCLTIGGGEPSLAKEQLVNLLYAIRNSRTRVGNLFVVTNGKNTPIWLLNWYIDFTENICDDNDVSAFSFSFDQWHDVDTNTRNRNFYRAQEYIFEQTGKEQVYKHSDEKWSWDHLIKMGRASNWGARDIEPELITIDEEDEGIITEGDIYWTVDGLMFSNCTLSYSIMNRKSKFYITDWKTMCNTPVIESVKEYNNKVESLKYECA